MESYYDGGMSSKVIDIGKMKFKFVFKRNLKKFLKWYFQDKFGLTLNLIGLVMMVI